MTLEATLERIAVALEAIAKTGGTLAQATAQLGTPEVGKPEVSVAATPAEKPAKGKAKAVEAAPSPAPAPTPAAPAAAPAEAPAAADEGPAWTDVLAQIQLLNKGTTEGQGRAGVEALLTHFGLDFKPVAEGGKGQTVPALKALNRNADVMAFVKARLQPAAAAAPAEIDLGL